ncbi:DUF1471 domain-containing protein [Morganella psychrotolerans]|uniref:DUF1471 domain-containing protein n=1 Tax=Morganella psychrotolerans TaxID=368603 RepID=A0A5M9R187_9GAMM|nr:DUF1471 domain-containing protein [Morganella psychrotolerans]KAA8713205.1 DUF1471 domain-containing protein [Morganella psychrotolerans]
MKKIIAVLVLGLFSYQGIASAVESVNQDTNGLTEKNRISLTGTDNNTAAKNNNAVLARITFTGDSNLESIEYLAIEKANHLGASHYKIIGAGGETNLRGYVIFYK